MKISILQPHTPHYRESFFRKLNQKKEIRLFCYEAKKASMAGFSESDITYSEIASKSKGPFLWYNPFTFLRSNSNTWILMLHFGHVTTWLLLLTKFIHRRKIILWGQGISVKRYLQEENHPDWKLKAMISMADGIWLYTDKEAVQWKKIFPRKPIVGLDNTQECVGGVKKTFTDIQALKVKYGITQERILIFSARFENPYRRTDLLLEVIKKLNPEKFGFIIIGSGSLKPDFSQFSNVYDFGALYDTSIKSDLFSIADIYFQPGWVGLSIVEAMAYSLPIFTFQRSENVKQCVEYSYIENNKNGRTFNSVDQIIETLNNLSVNEIEEMSINSHQYYVTYLLIDKMVSKAISLL